MKTKKTKKNIERRIARRWKQSKRYACTSMAHELDFWAGQVSKLNNQRLSH